MVSSINDLLDALGQTFAEALHMKVRVDVVTDVWQRRPKFIHSLRRGLPLPTNLDKNLFMKTAASDGIK